MDWVRQTRLPAGEHPPRSLSWLGDDLIDWVSGGATWTADRRFVPARVNWGYGRLDTVVTDATGRWAVVHERTGTAGIVLHDGEFVREIHRSLYHADAYVYPVCLFAGPDGRTMLAHCPDSYNRIEIEDAETGERIARSDSRQPPDLFHSRLAPSPGAKRVLSAGWVWHPCDAVVWFDVAAFAANPDVFDSTPHSRNVSLCEESSAAWLDDDRVLLGGAAEPEDPDEAADADREHPGSRLRPNGLAVYDIPRTRYCASFDLEYPPGIMMPVGRQHVVTFYRHPRLVSLATGAVMHEWAAIDSGEVVSSMVHRQRFPVLALDPARARFAVGTSDGIDVVAFDVAVLPSPPTTQPMNQ